MAKLRVLVADDSVVIRQMLVHVLSEEPGLEVAGTAPDGEIALAKIPQVSPDVVVLDVEMPNLDGLETLRRIRADYPQLPVLMFSSYTRLGAEATVDALLFGADDYAEKPSGASSRQEAFELVRQTLVPKIRAFAPLEKSKTPSPAPAPQAPGQRPPAGPVEAVVVGVSTGGPTALSTLLSGLPASFQTPMLIVQHMPALFTETLAQRLTAKSRLQVKEGKDGQEVLPGAVWLAPGDHHMVLSQDKGLPRLKLFQGPPVNSCRPSVDVLFESAAELYGNRLLAVILTGMGHDGLKGCEKIREKGGQVLAQDEATSAVWGMPGAVVQARLADSVMPLDKMAGEILRRIQMNQPAPRPVGA